MIDGSEAAPQPPKSGLPGSGGAVPAVRSTPGWTARRVFRRAREVLREQGPASLGFKLLGEAVYRRVWLYERRLDRVPGTAPGSRPGIEPEIEPRIEIAELAADQIDDYLRLRPEADPGQIAGRLRAGHRCYLARSAGHPVHAAWVGTGRVRIDYLGRELELEAGEAYVYEVHTAPAARGLGLSRAVAEAIAAALGREGFERLVAVVMPENRAGAAAIPSWGYRRVGRLSAVGIGRRRLALGGLAPAAARDGVASGDWSRALRRLEDHHYLDPFLGEVKRRAHLDLLRRWGSLRPDGRLLKTDLFEEAVGPDAFLADLTGEVSRAVGMDLSLAVVQRARARSGGARASWAVADARRLPFADGAFASVVSTSTLDHFPNPADLGTSLVELLRVLEPEGRLVITLDNRQNLLDPLLRLARRLRLLPYYVGRSYRAAELRAELERAGFAVGETTAILHNPRLFAVGAVRLARWLRVRPLIAAVERAILAAQRLEQTRWRYRTGSFVAAVGTRPVLGRR